MLGHSQTGRLLAVGDVHGCVRALEEVIAAVQLQPQDTLVMLGDYVDRGADSREVISFVQGLSKECHLVPLRGNHEELMLAACRSPNPELIAVWKQCGGDATLASYGGQLSDIPEDHLRWIESCSLYFETEDHIFVHANYDPDLAMDRQDGWHLLWPHLSSLPAPHTSGKCVVVGHTPQQDARVFDAGHVICIDTFCFGSGCLTALDVRTKQTWRADKDGTRWP